MSHGVRGPAVRAVHRRLVVKLLALAAIAFSAIGLVALSLQLLLVVWHRRRRRVDDRLDFVPVSILKPLCGRDDDLDENLRAFGELEYPSYEVLLGLRDANDAALQSALRAVRRRPDRFRLVFQKGEPGYNPKVNQLATLEREARFDILVVSDSNVRVGRDYLHSITSALSDPRVGCVTHPITGSGERRWGSLLDNLHLSAAIGRE